MHNSIVYPVMGVLTVIAGAVGLQLGESAIAQIDPVYFSQVRPPLRDVSRQEQPAAAPAFASAYGWAEGNEARDQDCGNCPAATSPAPYAALPQDAGAGFRAEPWRAPVTLDRADYEEQPDTTQWREVSRYVDYPVTQEQADQAEAAALERAAEAAVAPEDPVEAPTPAGL